MRYRSPFTLVRRTVNKQKNLKIYYYRLADDPCRVLRSTGQRNKQEARAWVEAMLARGPAANITLADYLAPWFIWDECQHVRRLREEGKSITRRHCQLRRLLIDNYLIKDALVKKRLADVTRGDILEMRTRMMKRHPDRLPSVAKALAVLKTVFHEALFRGDIPLDPMAGIGNLKTDKTIRGVFTRSELAALFVDCPGHWGSRGAFTAFALAASTGMRRGEILALRWRALDLDAGMIRITEAWKGGEEIGTPKSGKARVAPLTSKMVQILRDWFDESVRIAADDFVFCGQDGSRRGATWWKKHFQVAMIAAGIFHEEKKEKKTILINERRITPHSFRHTLNTLLRDAGQDPAKIRAALGWAGERVQDGYTHWDAEHLREQADKIAGFGL